MPYNKDELQDIITNLNLSISDSSFTSEHIFNVNDAKFAVSKLKPHKGEDNSGLMSDHIVNAGDDFLRHIALLFTQIVVHRSAPNNFLASTIVPIPKGAQRKYI